jgi:hypothetical protein
VLLGDHFITPNSNEVGNLEVGGMLSVLGNSIDLGTTIINSASQPGLIWLYSEAAGKPNITMDTILGQATFAWGEAVGVGRIDKMILKENNTLSLFAPGYSHGTPDNGLIRLVPKVASAGGSSVWIDGQRVLTSADANLFVTQSSGHVSGNLHVVGSLTSRGGSINLADSPWGGMTA